MQALWDAGWRGAKSLQLDKLDDFFTACSNDAVDEDIGFMHVTDLPDPPPLAVELRNAYEEKYGAGTWDPTGFLYFTAWYSFLAAVEKADSLEVEDIIAAYEGLEFDSAAGHIIMVKRPDIEQNRYVESVHVYYYQEVKDGELVYLDTHTAKEVIDGMIGLLGHAGEWR